MNTFFYSPAASMLIAVLFTVAGILLVVFRDKIGSTTGYPVGRGNFIDKPTPGCLLIPFGIALIVGGIVLFVRVLRQS